MTLFRALSLLAAVSSIVRTTVTPQNKDTVVEQPSGRIEYTRGPTIDKDGYIRSARGFYEPIEEYDEFGNTIVQGYSMGFHTSMENSSVGDRFDDFYALGAYDDEISDNVYDNVYDDAYDEEVSDYDDRE